MATTTQTRKLYNDEVTLHFNPKSRNRYQLADGTAPVGVTTVLSKVLAKEALMLWPMNMALGFLRQSYPEWELGTLSAYKTFEDLCEEASKAHTRKSDKGKDVGTEVHEAIEGYLNAVKDGVPATSPINISDQAKKAFKAFTEWFIVTQPKVLATEQIVYSRGHGYAGTFDALLEIDGKIVLCDVKTSNASRTSPTGIYPEYFLQLGAYSLAYQENADVLLSEHNAQQVDDLMVINASKQGNLSTLRASELGLSVADCERSWLQVLGLYRFMEPLKKVLKERE